MNAYIAPLNLSKLGFRYFRIILESKQFSQKFIDYLVSHPNTGYVFEGSGWSGKKRVLGIGIWATSNSEMADMATNIRSVIPDSYKVVYQSELTRLEYFTEVAGTRRPLTIIDELEQKMSLSALELDYLKLISVDGGLTALQRAALLNVSPADGEAIDKKLQMDKVFYGIFPDGALPPGYTKVFVDTTSLQHEALGIFFGRLMGDKNCVYLARGNGVYNVEFEYVLTDEGEFTALYGQFLKHSKRIRFEHNIYTNLFPQSKSLNTKIVQEKFIELAKTNDKHFDFSDSELWYVNHEGTQSYLNIYDNPEYQKAMKSGEVALFAQAIQAFATPETLYNVIDLGSGDGKKGKELIETIGIEQVRSYFPVDVQELELAQTLREHEGSSYAVHPTLLGFSKLGARFPLAARDNERNVFGFFGGTYGNYEAKVINQYLKPLLLSERDTLLLAMPIRDFTNRASVTNSYLDKSMEGVAFGVLKQIGFERADFEQNRERSDFILQLRWEDNRLRTGFTLKRNKLLHGLHLEAGTTFNLTSSWKPTLAEFRAAVATDFVVVDMVSNRSFAIAVCKRKSGDLKAAV